MTQQDLLRAPDRPSRFSYGYVVVGAACIIMMVAQGLFNSFGVIFSALLDEFGWTRTLTSGAFSLSMAMRGLLGIVMGGLTDRFGARNILVVCGVLLGAGYLLLATTSQTWQIYLFYGVLLGSGMSGIWVPLLSTIARWFDARRNLMTGIVVAGVAVGGLAAPPLLNRLIEATHWRTAYLVQGGIALVVVVAAALFLRSPERRPAVETASPVRGSLTIGQALRTPQLWLSLFLIFCSGYVVFSLLTHIVLHATGLGIAESDASLLLGTMNGLSIIGIIGLAGFLGDRLGSRRVFLISFIMMLGAVVLLLFARELWMLYAILAVFGIALGAESASESPLIAGLFGIESHGIIFGVAGIGFTAGTAIGPLVTGYLYDHTGSYDLAFKVCAIVVALAIVAVLLLHPVKRSFSVASPKK